MPELAGWNQHTRPQRDLVHGPIPTGFEFLVRFADIGIPEKELALFQEKYDLRSKGMSNDFSSVSKAIHEDYGLEFEVILDFAQTPEGAIEKMNYVRKKIEDGIPVLLSVMNDPVFDVTDGKFKGTSHIMPVVTFEDEAGFITLWDPTRELWILKTIDEIIGKHVYVGGVETACLNLPPTVVNN